jgi:hypothetical protein
MSRRGPQAFTRPRYKAPACSLTLAPRAPRQVTELLGLIRLIRKWVSCGTCGGPCPQTIHDIQIREFALGILRKFHAGHLSTQLYIGHQSPDFSAEASTSSATAALARSTTSSPSPLRRSARRSR